MTIPEPLAAVRQLLRNDATLTAIVPAARIYAGVMPKDEIGAQPRATVVLMYAGGRPELDHVQIARPRFDVRSYGANSREAATVSLAVHELLKNASRVRVTGGAPAITPTLIHGVQLEGGPTLLYDPDGDWPFVLRTYLVTVAEVAA